MVCNFPFEKLTLGSLQFKVVSVQSFEDGLKMVQMLIKGL